MSVCPLLIPFRTLQLHALSFQIRQVTLPAGTFHFHKDRNTLRRIDDVLTHLAVQTRGLPLDNGKLVVL
jgi:hypothetical protein